MKGYFGTSRSSTQLGGPHTPFTFSGDAVAVYGTVSPFHPNYTVTVDGVHHNFLGGSNGLASDMHKGTLLYFANNMAAQPHNLTLTASPGQPKTGKFMDLDKIVVFARNDSNSTLSNNITTQPNPVNMAQIPMGNAAHNIGHNPQASLSSKRPSPLVIKMLVAGISIFILLLLLLLAVILIRRRRANGTYFLKRQLTPTLPLQTPPGISPQSPGESKLQNPFYDHSDLEKGVEPPLSVVQLQPALTDGNPFADKVMQDSRDDRWDGESRNQGSVSSAPVRCPRPPPLKLPPDSELPMRGY